MHALSAASAALRALPPEQRFGEVVAVRGAMIEVAGLAAWAQIGSRMRIHTDNDILEAEVTGLDHGVCQCMPFRDPQGIGAGMRFDEMIVSPQYCVDRHGQTLYQGDDNAVLRWGDARG